MKVPRNLFDWITDLVCILVLLGTFGFIGSKYSSLPDQVPTHYDFAGNITSYGGKASVWIMPVVALILGYLLMVLLEQFPQAWNTGIRSYDKKSRASVYRAVKDLMNHIKLANTIFMCAMGIYTCLIKNVPFVLVIIYIAALVFAIVNYSVKLKNKGSRL